MSQTFRELRMASPEGEITRLVTRWSEGEEGAFEQLIDLVYDDLRRIAHHHLLRIPPNEIVDTTVLVHEAYLKLARVEGGDWGRRAQFFAFCSKVMRRILIDFARGRRAAKRGGMSVRVPLNEEMAGMDDQVDEILAVEEVLRMLEERNGRMARIVECRFFGGMSVPETAAALGTSTRTVEREWARARVYLRRTLDGRPEGHTN